MPDAAETAAAQRLPAGEHDKRRGPAGGELALGFVIGAVDLGQAEDVQLPGGRLQVGLHEQGVEAGRPPDDPVAAAAYGLELETLVTQLAHVHPDADAAHAEFAGEDVPGHESGFVFEQFAEDDEFGGNHGSRVRGRSPAGGGWVFGGGGSWRGRHGKAGGEGRSK